MTFMFAEEVDSFAERNNNVAEMNIRVEERK